MPVAVLMPALSPTMEKGKLAKWHVREGDKITAGDVIAEIETDKATMEVEAIEEGRIGKIYVDEGADDVAVNATIAMILLEDESDADLADVAAVPPMTNGNEANGNGASGGNDAKADMTASAASSLSNGGQPSVGAPAAQGEGERLFASPLARRLAANANMDLQAISGSGPRGRIVKRDVEQAMQSGGASLAKGATAAAGMAAVGGAVAHSVAGLDDREIFSLYEEGGYELTPHDNMRRVIADRLTLAKSTIPHFYLTIDCQLDELLRARKRMNETAVAEGVRLSVNDFIIKALALALQKVPDANATWSDKGLLRHKRSDVAVAVAVEGGLFTPVVRDADQKSLSDISSEMKDLAHRARNKKLAPHEYQGGTTSISNLGMFDIKQFEAVINPPHASILAVGRGEQRPIVKNGELAVATVMSCSLSCDHRVIDGALGAELLKAFKTYIEQPVTMLA